MIELTGAARGARAEDVACGAGVGRDWVVKVDDLREAVAAATIGGCGDLILTWQSTLEAWDVTVTSCLWQNSFRWVGDEDGEDTIEGACAAALVVFRDFMPVRRVLPVVRGS